MSSFCSSKCLFAEMLVEQAFEFAAAVVSNMEIYISVIIVWRCYVNERITNDIFPEFLPLSFLYYAKEKLDYWGK